MNPTPQPSHNPHGPHPGTQPSHQPGSGTLPGSYTESVHQAERPQPMQPHHQPQYTHLGQQQPSQPHHQDYNQPVAYDVQGRPLYLHPHQSQPPVPPTPQQPQMVYLARPLEPEDPHISEEVLARHEESRKKFPHLNLSAGEYVVVAVKRHPVGIMRIWAVTALLMILFSAMAAMFLFSPTMHASGGTTAMLTVGLILVYVIIILGALASTYIYEANRFYMTNESVIQEIQTSLFDKREQTVSLGNIEDASYRQTNFVQTFLNYGSIRLSTEGDETTYRFDYVAAPKQHIATLNNAVESFKNGRPVE